MKNTCTFFILGIALLFPFSHFAQDFYYYKGDSVHLLTDSTLCAFSFFDPTQSFVLDSLEIEFQILDSNFYAVDAAERGLLDSLGLSQEHLCKRIGAHQVFIRNDIILKPLQTTTQAILDSLMNSYGLMLLEERHGMLRCASLDPVSQSSQLFESNYFEFCEPNIYQRIIPAQHIPDDPYFNRQWNFHQDANTVINDGITGLLDADIDLPEAWDLTTGSPNVVIAVLDFTGVSANHPDLPLDRQLRLPGSNFSYLQDGSSADDPSPNTIYSDYYIGHGDACAGILSGEMDNEMGIAGISSGCKIMPIRYGEVMSSWNANLSFIFPVDNGADIISCSFGFTASSEAIDLSLSYCFQNNVLVVFAAGNSANHQTGFDYTNVLYPANSDIQGVISVGASNYLDQQADYSPSSEFIDIVAPSAHDFQTSMNPQNNGVVYSQVEGEGPNIWTTDLPGDGGYNPWSSDQVGAIPQLNEQLPDDGIQSLDYTGRFFGTSAATPQVAGVAALMRSANSCLTNTEITQILYESADKIGDPTLYDNQGHCDEFGYGRLNAFQAVLMALDAGDIHFEVYYLCQDNATTKIWIGVEGDVNDYHFALNESTVEAQTEIDLALFTAPFYLKATKLNSGCTSMRRLFPEDHTHQVTMNTSTTMPVCSNPFGGAIDASASNLDQSATTLTWNMSDDDLSLSGLQSNNLEVGAYTIIVTNETGCSDIESVSLSTGIANCCDVIDVNIQDQTNNICPGLDDASLAIVAIGGSADYDAIWTSASNFQINNSILSPDFGVLNAGCGAYGLVIEDLYWGCQTGPQPFLIDCNTNEIIFTFDPIREASCELNCDGGTLVNISGGVAPYQYELNEESIADLITVNALCHGEHLLHITDVNGCTNELTINVGFEPYDYPTGHTYNGENWDGETIIVNGNLEIPAGLWPDMFDVEFIMTEGSEILVSTNAQIKWSEVDVTACGNQWNGISFSDFSIANINGAFSWDDGQCSLADKAISVEGTFEVPLTIHDMEIKGVNFMNNRRGLLVNNSGVALSSAFFGPIVFENCTFQINNDYFQHFTAVDAQVRMVNAKGYGFRSCAFLNNTDSPFWSDRGRAIDAYNSWFDVDDLDETGFDTNGSLFRGWNMGINALCTDMSGAGVFIRANRFEENHVAIHNMGVGFQTIILNDILVGDTQSGRPWEDDATEREGIVISGGAGGFLVTENNVVGGISNGAVRIGIRSRDIVSSDAEVYNNTVKNLNYPLLANGNNSIFNEGLRYVCNNAILNGLENNNEYDIFIGDFVDGTSADISPWQSDLGLDFILNPDELPAGNGFTTNPSGFNIVNYGEVINYLYNNNAIEIPGSIDGSVNLFESNNTNDCESSISGLVPDNEQESIELLADLESAKESTFVTWKEASFLYQAIIDNGSTQELIELVEGAWDANIWEVRSTMLQQSPFLSETVLIKLAEYMPGIPYVVALEIFLANPNVTATPQFIGYLAQESTMPEFMIDLLRISSTPNAIRTELEAQLAKSHMTYLENRSNILRLKCRMPNFSNDSLLNALKDFYSINAEFALVQNRLCSHGLDSALTRLYQVADRLKFPKLEVKDEIEQFEEWLNIISGYDDIWKLSSETIDSLIELSVDWPWTIA